MTTPGSLASVYDRSGLSAEELRRAEQLEALYGFPFPTEIFTFWRWFQGLGSEQRESFEEILGIGLVGPFDVLVGSFDDFRSAYPMALHWRFRADPPELVTLWMGNTDGLHWGFWFDDHRRLPPVVVGTFARDAFDLWYSGDTLFGALRSWFETVREDLFENLQTDPESAEVYRDELRRLEGLKAILPVPEERPARPTALDTGDGMGIVPPARGGERALEALRRGKEAWREDPRRGCEMLREAYALADRPVLAAIAAAHGGHPVLPGVSLLDYPVGSYHDLARALAEPERVTALELAGTDLAELPDLSALTRLERLSLYGNRLTDLPATLAACRRLRKVNLARNALTAVPEVLFRLPLLEEVILGREIPEEEKDELRAALPDASVH